jgi:hypothetical protein
VLLVAHAPDGLALSVRKRFCSEVRDRAAFAKATAPKEDALARAGAALVFFKTETIEIA